MAVCQGDLLTERFLIRQRIFRQEGRGREGQENWEEMERLCEKEREISQVLEGLGYWWR